MDWIETVVTSGFSWSFHQKVERPKLNAQSTKANASATSLPITNPPTRSLAHSPRRLYDRSFAIAALSQTCFVAANTLMAHYARWIDFLGGGVREVGWIMGTGSIAGLLLRPWMGQWINRVGARNTWALGLIVFAVGALGNLLLHDLGWLIYVLRSLLVLGAAMVFASSLTYVTLTCPPERRTEAIGILGAGGFLGMLVGPFTGDLLLGAVDRTRGDFTLLFLTTLAAVVLTAVLLCYLRAPSVKGHATPTRLIDFLRTVWQYWPGTILLVVLAFGLSITIPFVFLTKYVDEANLRIPGRSVVGLYFLGYAGWGFVVRVGLRRVPDLIGRRKVLLVGLVSMSAGMFCFLLVDATNPWWLMVPAVVCGTGHALMFHTMTALSLESFPSTVRGSGSALTLMMLDLGLIAGPPVLGQIAASVGYDGLFVTVGLCCLAVAGVYTASSVPVWRARRLARLSAEALRETSR